MDNLRRLYKLCKCSVSIEINRYRVFYDTIEDAVNNKNISEEIKRGIIKTNNFIEIQFYPDTPIGFYTVYHYDIDLAINEALSILDNR